LVDPDAATPEQVEQCFLRPYRDGVPLELDPRPFHLLILSRAKSRVVLRRAETKALKEVVRSVRQWAEDVRIVPRFDKDKLGLWHLARATVSPKERNPDPPADLATRLYACALDDRLPLPAELTAIIMRRIRSHDGGGETCDLTVTTARVALLKASFNRTYRLHPGMSPIGKEFAVSLDLTHPHPSYHLGRLFAVLERIQGEAIDDINASICDRFLGQALAAPALVFPRLMKLSHHHLGKIGGNNAGRRVNLDKLVDEIVGRVDSCFPRTQPLAEQGIFIIGYHHQRAAFFAKKDAVASVPNPSTI
jgi:CRISPR-associated protein Csd1